MTIIEAYDYLNDVRNPMPPPLLVNRLTREETLKILAVLKWIEEAKL